MFWALSFHFRPHLSLKIRRDRGQERDHSKKKTFIYKYTRKLNNVPIKYNYTFVSTYGHRLLKLCNLCPLQVLRDRYLLLISYKKLCFMQHETSEIKNISGIFWKKKKQDNMRNCLISAISHNFQFSWNIFINYITASCQGSWWDFYLAND